ncbi:hypothetical protein WA026_017251 [Henosepilachna vigintioctopunctata]|uniref:Uncharacterized protein n=1 Tax=Henosepilachna vigintioctopunctata TaxID=420089 RepID=A0AAW1UKW9_9CUCU
MGVKVFPHKDIMSPKSQSQYKSGNLVGVWKCCLPWCAPAEGKAQTSSPPTPPEPASEAPTRVRQPSPLHDIQEEETDLLVDEEFNPELVDEAKDIKPTGLVLGYKKNWKIVRSASPTLSIRSGRKTHKSRSVTSSTSSEVTSSTISVPVSGKMQAEQGSIGDLQKYHNRYLRNRRHTLANVR